MRLRSSIGTFTHSPAARLASLAGDRRGRGRARPWPSRAKLRGVRENAPSSRAATSARGFVHSMPGRVGELGEDRCDSATIPRSRRSRRGWFARRRALPPLPARRGQRSRRICMAVTSQPHCDIREPADRGIRMGMARVARYDATSGGDGRGGGAPLPFVLALASTRPCRFRDLRDAGRA